MDLYCLGQGAAIALLLGLSAGFSGSETAFFSLDRGLLGKIRNRDPQRSAAIEALRKKPRYLLATILSGNELVNTGVAVLATSLTYTLFHGTRSGSRAGAAVALGSFVLIVCGEITPKAFALRYPERALRFALPLVRGAGRLLFPLTRSLQWLADGGVRLFCGERRASEEWVDEAVFRSLLDVGQREGVIQESEKALIHRLFEFDDLVVSDVMTPRTEIFMLPDNIGLGELVAQAAAKKFSRIPIFGRNRDEIVGVLYAKDLLKFQLKGRGAEAGGELPRELLIQPLFVPAGKPVVELFRTFQERQLHLAVVVDEYGGVVGLVTMEDLLEELFGEIRDEYDLRESSLQHLGPRHYLVAGRESLDNFCRLLGAERPRISSRTVNGLLLSLFGHLPREGEAIAFQRWRLTVRKVSGTRVTQVEAQGEAREEGDGN